MISDDGKELFRSRIATPKESYHEIIDVSETATDKDQILQRSKAMGFAKKNKLRWHALGMIQSFHLPHLFTSVSNNFDTAFHEYAKDEKSNQTLIQIGNPDLLEEIKKSNAQELEILYKENKAVISKDIHLTSAIGKRKKELINE